MKDSLIIYGDSREVLKSFRSEFDLIVTSPPYADARKKHYDSIHPDEFANWFISFHDAFYDALKPNGSLVINIKDKVVNGTRHRFVWETIRLLEDKGWYSIEDYIWHKTNPMPGYWPTRLRDGWEYCFHLSKTKRPYINFDAVRRPIGDWAASRLANLSVTDRARHNSVNASGFGRDISKWVKKESVLPSNVISVPLVGKNMGHPAVFPLGLPKFFIKLLTPENARILDPFGGSGTTGVAAAQENKQFVLIDNNLGYCRQAKIRLEKESNVSLDITQLDKRIVPKELINSEMTLFNL
ncbi:MAG TPA: site-specific DNA-methyltransferase [Candidatus Paceibacterota bacterium]|nr:site-specific DNA-methyltransferase [Candidatus Paceibacterota bacterium]